MNDTPAAQSPAKAGVSPSKAEDDTVPHLRKRQRIEYEAYKRPYLDRTAGWDVLQVEEAASAASGKRQRRAASDIREPPGGAYSEAR